jgi:hypothetical protein
MGNEDSDKNRLKSWKGVSQNPSPGVIYCLGIIGAAVYFVQHSTSFWEVAFAVVKALFWPAFLLYKAFELLGV